ncbi:MAG: PatB family C-S lyase [Gammaproteobacteria bacterium]|nr:PatB family C-S lyase [Gammaproteobacteria bacterium]
MDFDFDDRLDRGGTSSTKYEKYRDRDVLPLWVADMDFRSPPAVIEALQRRVDHGVFGYVDTPQELVELVRDRLARWYDWRVEAVDLVFLPGVVPALNLACRTFCGAGDGVITNTPIYTPFMSAPRFSGRRLIKVPGRIDKAGWSVDTEALERAAADASLLLLCNPWNPVGRVLTREELASIAEICVANDVIILLGRDSLRSGVRWSTSRADGHPGGDVADHCVTLMAPSKTFNLAGFGGSFAVIENDALRARFLQAKRGIMANVNIMAYESMIAAYRDGEEWRRALVDYLQGNRDYLAKVFDSLPGIHMNAVEGTYLAWLDVSELGLEDPPAFFEAAGLGMSEGRRFDDDRYMRLNFGCARSMLEEAASRFEAALR